MERLEKNRKISSDERRRHKDEIKTKEGKPEFADSAKRVKKGVKENEDI